MGWNTWNKFGCSINEHLIKETADQLVSLGLDKVGYEYVNLDDCWMLKERDQKGHIVVDPKAFPSGMKALGDYLHGKGLKFGLYSSAGQYSCEKRAGSQGHEQFDAEDLASFDIDYLKYDNCYNDGSSGKNIRYPAMRDALNKTGRPIFYSICNWGDENTWEWGHATANSWRTTQDIFDGWVSIEYNFYESSKYAAYAQPGAWNDPDMLEIGMGAMTIEEEKSHFALWAISKAPLIIGCDLTKIRKQSLDILMNKEVIAVDQDTLGKQGVCVQGCDWWDKLWRLPSVYAAPMSNGDVVMVLLNWREVTYGEFVIDVSKLGLNGYTHLIRVRDLWQHKDIGTLKSNEFKISSIPPHGNHALRFINDGRLEVK